MAEVGHQHLGNGLVRSGPAGSTTPANVDAKIPQGAHRERVADRPSLRPGLERRTISRPLWPARQGNLRNLDLCATAVYDSPARHTTASDRRAQ